MGTTGCKGGVFVIFNILFWLIGSAVLGYAIWILVSTSNYNHFLEGTLIFTYSFLAVGLLIFIAGLLGCIGGCGESTCCLKAYVVLMTSLLIIDVGVAVAGFTQKDKVFDITDGLWEEVNQDTRNQIQTQLKCCGFDGQAEYTGQDIPDSCYEDAAKPTTIYTTSCHDAMKGWVEDNIPIWASILGAIGAIQPINIHKVSKFPMTGWVEDNIPMWASILGATGVIQLLSLVMACVVMTEIQNKMRVSDLDGNYG